MTDPAESTCKPQSPRTATVALRQCADNSPGAIHAAVRQALADTPEFAAWVTAGKRVFLKLNLVVVAEKGDGITTDPEVVRAVVEAVRERGAIPVAGDNPAVASAAAVLKASGIGQVLEELKVEVPDLKEVTPLACPRGKDFREFQISKAIADADVLLSLPKLKTHALTYMSMATKNLFGTIPGTRKARWHMKAPHAYMMAGLFNDLYTGLLDHFAAKGGGIIHLCDGVTALEGDGPGHSGTPKFLGAILCSSDAVALDSVGVRVAGLDPGKLTTLELAMKRGTGVGDIGDIRIVGDAIGDFAAMGGLKPPAVGGRRPEGFGIRICNMTWVRNIMTDHPVLAKPSKCVGCRRCAEICPAGAISFESSEGAPKTPSFDKTPCIRCYCCAEVCPQGAIGRSRISLLGRLLRKL